MRTNKEKLHAIGNYLLDRYGFRCYFKDEDSAHPSILFVEDLDIDISFSPTFEQFEVKKDLHYGYTIQYFDTPLQVCHYIITRKFEENYRNEIN